MHCRILNSDWSAVEYIEMHIIVYNVTYKWNHKYCNVQEVVLVCSNHF